MLLTIRSVHRADLTPLPIDLYVCELNDGVLMLTRHRRGYRACVTAAPDSDEVRHRFDAETAEALWQLVDRSHAAMRPGEPAIIEARERTPHRRGATSSSSRS